jgi:hypothetical protein
MAYRRFTDSGGTTWRVWDVLPSPIDRRFGMRRIQMVKIAFGDRRVIPDRRVDMRRSRLYFPPTETGWLTFESDTAKRRLRPIPPGWALAPDEVLEELCNRAAERDVQASV